MIGLELVSERTTPPSTHSPLSDTQVDLKSATSEFSTYPAQEHETAAQQEPPRNGSNPSESILPADGAFDPDVVVYGNQRKRAPSSPHSGNSFYLGPRLASWLVFLVLQFGIPFSLLTIARFVPDFIALGYVGMLTFMFGWPISRLLTRLIVPLLVPTVRCPGCHEEYEAVDRWKCSCGFGDYRERHFLNFKCPKCKGLLGYMNCKRCDATMILR